MLVNIYQTTRRHFPEGSDPHRQPWERQTPNQDMIPRSDIYKSGINEEYFFWDNTPCRPLKVNRRFGGTYCLHIQGRRRNCRTNQRESRLLILRPSRWERYFPPKRPLTFNRLHGVISQKIVFFISTALTYKQ
jgi:hypothetical protein